MVMKTMSVSQTSRALSPSAILVRSAKLLNKKAPGLKGKADSEAGDVIDLGAPRLLQKTPPERHQDGSRKPRSRPPYTPNPRLYPGPRHKQKPRQKRAEAHGGEGRRRRRKRVFRRLVPNARLYRPTPARPPPPPAWPRAAWPPPAPPARLDTASRVALRLSEQRREPRAPLWASRAPPLARAAPAAPPAPATPAAARDAPAPASRRLVVTVPAAPAELPRYRPASEHFRLLSLDTDSDASTPVAGRPAAWVPRPVAAPAMDAANRHSTSPEDCSDGNETLSAPSEFLAEFLSAIMRRQYAEALKYCRLILQYEPHNATARGFYPLLQHKLQSHKRTEGGEWRRGSSSEEVSAHSDKPPLAAQGGHIAHAVHAGHDAHVGHAGHAAHVGHAGHAANVGHAGHAAHVDHAGHAAHALPDTHDVMEQGADSSEGSGGAPHSRSSSRSRSRASCASQSSLELDSSDAPAHSSPSLSLSRRTERSWESTASEPDDNGNAPLASPAPAPDDHDNANAAAARQTESSSSLRRLRAQFTCSIK